MNGYKWFNHAYDRNVIYRPEQSMSKSGLNTTSVSPTSNNRLNNLLRRVGGVAGIAAQAFTAAYGYNLMNKVRDSIAANSYRTTTPDKNYQPAGSPLSAYSPETNAKDVINMSNAGEHVSEKSMNAQLRSLQILTKTLLLSLR